MHLNASQISRAHNFFKQLLSTDPERLKKLEIVKCKSCDGTGLGGIKKLPTGGYSWPDTCSYCEDCYGVGFKGLRNLKTFDNRKYICGKCNGVGCDKCDDGFVDWITHAMGR
jgi:DnaJ-class molecular chaperone